MGIFMNTSEKEPALFKQVTFSVKGEELPAVYGSTRIKGPDGKTLIVPCFKYSENEYAFRFYSRIPGVYKYKIDFDTNCDNNTQTNNDSIFYKTPKNICLDDPGQKKGSFTLAKYNGNNPLYKHGGIKASEKGRYLEHEDGTPFLWLGDTWWMALSERLGFPEDFMELANDRAEKGFNVVQLTAGFMPDMKPFDPRGRAKSGFPWKEDLVSVNTEYFAEAEEKIEALIELGILPCILGSWGYYADLLGFDLIRRHWRYIVARWSAYPIVWCAAGEAVMPYYNRGHSDAGDHFPGVLKDKGINEYTEIMRSFWSGICRQISQDDPYKRPVTIHPTDHSHLQVEDKTVLDIEMLQTGHNSFTALLPAIEKIRRSLKETDIPVINAEACYEGICGGNEAEVQRFSFWSSVLCGCCGYTYGANGVWQLNLKDEPFGHSPHGVSWGDMPWAKAKDLPGSGQIGKAAKLLRSLNWQEFELHPEWSDKPFRLGEDGSLVHKGEITAGIPGKIRIYYRPLIHGFFWGEELVRELEQGKVYNAYYFDPIDGKISFVGKASGNDSGQWRSPRVDKFRDWILLLVSEDSGIDLDYFS